MNTFSGKLIVFSDGSCSTCIRDRRWYEKLAGKTGNLVEWLNITGRDDELLQEGINSRQGSAGTARQRCSGPGAPGNGRLYSIDVAGRRAGAAGMVDCAAGDSAQFGLALPLVGRAQTSSPNSTPKTQDTYAYRRLGLTQSERMMKEMNAMAISHNGFLSVTHSFLVPDHSDQ